MGTGTDRTVEQIKTDLTALQNRRRDGLNYGDWETRFRPLVIELLRAKVHQVCPDALALVFSTAEWDDGVFFTNTPELLLPDEEFDGKPFLCSWHDALDEPGFDLNEEFAVTYLSDLCGPLALYRGVAVDLVKMEIGRVGDFGSVKDSVQR